MTKAIAKVAPTKEAVVQDAVQLCNSLSALACDLAPGFGAGGFNVGGVFPGVQLSQPDTMFANNRWYLISNMRQLLSETYVEHGIVQTLVDQPVDDAFGRGITVKTSELSKDQIEELLVYVEEFQIIEAIKQGIKWKRLFGGGGVLIITDQDPKVPFNINRVTEDSPLEFRPVDMWELYANCQNWEGTSEVGGQLGANCGDFYQYYQCQVHQSRVLRMVGKEAPSFIRPRLRGWGMSELERLVRSFNQYLKNQDVIFELLDEAKIDVYKIDGFNAALLNAEGTEKIRRRIQLANLVKNYQNAIVMDKNDEYEQKQMTFAGLSEVLLQIRQGIAADLKMPVTKLFGISAAGFNSGEDEIENYNAMIESEIRAKEKWHVVKVLKICSKKLFNHVPEDLIVEFPSLRILKETEEEEIKDRKFNRVMAAWTSGLVPDQETKEAINKDGLLPVEIDESTPAEDPVDGNFLVGGDKVKDPL